MTVAALGLVDAATLFERELEKEDDEDKEVEEDEEIIILSLPPGIVSRMGRA
jgi:hypothetical protein